ncbi:MAG: FAD-binding oxidoreductase [Planctomycetes bacterium]|nr:FAD-binding oxidoreductase [Planctomycetota bacterium]
MTDIVVVGGGVIGLTAAAELLARGHRVEVWTRDDVRDTVSAVAAAVWYPYLAEPRERVDAWAKETHARLVELAAAPGSGVSLLPLVELFATATPSLTFLPPGVAVTRRDPRPFGAGYGAAIELAVPLCDTTVYLPWLRDLVVARGGAIVRRELADFEPAFAAASVVVNCTGLGARELCGDGSLVPVRGQVLCVDAIELPHGLIDDTDPAQPIYVLPRGGDVVLGGTAQRGVEDRDADPAATGAIRVACERHFPALAHTAIRGVKVGLRPFRPAVRLEVDPGSERPLIHDYGHGGSGFTLAWGCAVEVANLVDAFE